MKKLLKVMTLFVALALTACGAPSGESAEPSSAEPHKHKYVEDAALAVEATCDQEGKKVSVCSCGDKKETVVPALGHDFTGTGTAEAATDGCSATELVKCARCNKNAIRWTASDYDASSTKIEAAGSDGSIRLQKAQYDGGDETELGSHLIFKINSYTAAQNVSLSFKIKQKSDWDGPLFDYQSGDQQQGYIKKADGSLELTTKRSGLKVNNEDVALGNDETNVSRGTEGWFDWPVSFNVTAGVNTVEVICLGGYRAYLFNFEITGLPAKA